MGAQLTVYVGPFALADEDVIAHMDAFPGFWANQFAEGDLLKPRELWRGRRVVILPSDGLDIAKRPLSFGRDDCQDSIEILGGWHDEWNRFMEAARGLRMLMERENINHEFTWGVVPYWM